MARSVHISWVWLCGALAVVVLATLTPQPGPTAGADFFVPLLPERLGQWRDVCQNVVLYLPLGLHVRTQKMVWRTSGSCVSAILSLVIELLQFVVPGRDPIARDVVTNTIGGAIGWAVSRTPLGDLVDTCLRAPGAMAGRPSTSEPACRRVLSLGWALVVAVTTALSCWLFRLDLPPPSSSVLPLLGRPPVGPVISAVTARDVGFTGLIDEVRIYTRARAAGESRRT